MELAIGLGMDTLNSFESILALTPVPEPEYARLTCLQWLRNRLRLEVRWVDSIYGVEWGNAPGGSLYDQCVLLLSRGTEVESYVHEMCHALVARAVRPKTWRKLPNYGCESSREELEACYVQFALLHRWGCWDRYDPVSILQDYSFDMEIPLYYTDPGYGAHAEDLWRRVVRRGHDTAKKYGFPLSGFPKKS